MDGSLLAALPGAWDMHDLGDALVESRFSDPVMDMEYLYLDYESDALYLQDALALGLLSAQQVAGNFCRQNREITPKNDA
jgi:malonyl-CoA O-methyltransferase